MLFYLYIYFSVSRSGELIIIVNEAIRSIGYKPDNHKGRINDEFESFLMWLIDRGYIEVIKSQKGYIKYRALPKMDEKPFGVIRYHEYRKIIENENNSAAAIIVLAFIRINTYKGKNRNRPEIFFCHLSDVPEKLGLSYRTISLSLDIISSLGFVHSEEQKRYKDKHDNWHSGVYMFLDKKRYINDMADPSYDWEKEFDVASKWLKQEQLKYIN